MSYTNNLPEHKVEDIDFPKHTDQRLYTLEQALEEIAKVLKVLVTTFIDLGKSLEEIREEQIKHAARVYVKEPKLEKDLGLFVVLPMTQGPSITGTITMKKLKDWYPTYDNQYIVRIYDNGLMFTEYMWEGARKGWRKYQDTQPTTVLPAILEQARNLVSNL